MPHILVAVVFAVLAAALRSRGAISAERSELITPP
jgi:hypothetical protein